MRKKQKRERRWSNVREKVFKSRIILAVMNSLPPSLSLSWREKNNVIRAYISERYPRESLGGGYPPQRYADSRPKVRLLFSFSAPLWPGACDPGEKGGLSFLLSRRASKIPRVLRGTMLGHLRTSIRSLLAPFWMLTARLSRRKPRVVREPTTPP